MKARTIAMVVAACSVVVGATALAKTTQPATKKPAVKSTPVTAKVLAVWGKVCYRQIGETSWKNRLKQGQVLPAGTEISASLNGKAKLQLHTTAIVQIESMTVVAIAELTETPDSVKTRLFLRRGAIRAGIIEEKKRSDFQIACPAAVLSREGTWGAGMEYDPNTGKFTIYLDTEGLVRAVNIITGRRRAVGPGESVSNAMQSWFQTASMERITSWTDPFGITKIEKLNYAQNPGGLAAADPAGGGAWQRRAAMGAGADRLQQAQTRTLMSQLPQPEPYDPTKPLHYRPGDFGTQIKNGGSFMDAVRSHLLKLNQLKRNKRR